MRSTVGTTATSPRRRTRTRRPRAGMGHRRVLVRLSAVLAMLAGSVGLASAAGALNAGVGMSVTPLFPPLVAVGQTNVVVGLFITNA
jgi:hypothetical protein